MVTEEQGLEKKQQRNSNNEKQRRRERQWRCLANKLQTASVYSIKSNNTNSIFVR